MKNITKSWAVAEAARCLLCNDAPCQQACPAGVDVPLFIRAIRFDDPNRALSVIMDTNVLAGTCGVLCRHELLCEGACTSNAMEDPIHIGRLQTYAAMYGKNDPSDLPVATKGPVAVIGGGPAGISAAMELRKNGVNVTIFEAGKRLGGVLAQSLPGSRLPADLTEKEVKRVESMGVDVRYNSPLSGTNSVKNLLKTGFKAIFLGLGRTKSKKMGIEGEGLSGVTGALEFLESARHTMPETAGKRVAVVGGGSVAVDAALTALEAGADVTIVYRRSTRMMPATPSEKAELVQKGVNFLCNRLPDAIRVHEDRLEMDTIGVIWEDLDVPKPRKWHAEPDSLWKLRVDQVIIAVGEAFDPGLDAGLDGIERARDRAIKVNDLTTNMPGVFAGGDCINGTQGTIVAAVAQGRDAARAIIEFLGGNDD